MQAITFRMGKQWGPTQGPHRELYPVSWIEHDGRFMRKRIYIHVRAFLRLAKQIQLSRQQLIKSPPDEIYSKANSSKLIFRASMLRAEPHILVFSTYPALSHHITSILCLATEGIREKHCLYNLICQEILTSLPSQLLLFSQYREMSWLFKWVNHLCIFPQG